MMERGNDGGRERGREGKREIMIQMERGRGGRCDAEKLEMGNGS